MALQITGTNLEISPAVRRYVERKFGKLNRHMSNIIDISVELSEEKTKDPQSRFLVHATVAGMGTTFHAEERGPDPHTAVDKVSEIMVRQVETYKGKRYDRSRSGSPRTEAVQEAEAAAAAQPAPPGVVKVKRFLMKPMTVEQAAREMEALNHDFFLFLNADVKQLNVLYRRKDGNYGLIEPETK